MRIRWNYGIWYFGSHTLYMQSRHWVPGIWVLYAQVYTCTRACLGVITLVNAQLHWWKYLGVGSTFLVPLGTPMYTYIAHAIRLLTCWCGFSRTTAQIMYRVYVYGTVLRNIANDNFVYNYMYFSLDRISQLEELCYFVCFLMYK